MALKDNWVDKIDGVDDVLSEHINDVAHGVIELEEKQKSEAEPNSAAIRGSSGQLKVATPTENDDSINLKFFKEMASNALIGEKSGSMVVVDDVSPNNKNLAVVSTIDPVQGDGVPSLDNPLLLGTRSGVSLTVSNESESKEFYIDFGQDVYGGSFDWATGVLTVDWVKITNDELKTAKLHSTNDYGIANFVIGVNYLPLGAGVKDRAMCDRLPLQIEAPISTTKEAGIFMSNEFSLYIRLFASDVPDKAAFNSWVDTYEPQVVYQLKKPYTIQLTPQQIEALGEITTLSSDTGDTAVKYNRDINKAFAEIMQAIISLGGNV